ncbi:glycosyltransferase [Thomasclavelia sp.]|uniref:glycosyltransferase n=1 Tax=Thomasclavelia sp. TaxID=3025757 RepID=UPI0025DEFE34|nr:glycosyltransferase [Thomasclavelia sp.]
MEQEYRVSVCVITYNQKKYIEQALNSILDQKTNFEFEVLVHDDCSSDGTVEILKRYKKKYPDKITLLLERENQYSKGKKIMPLFIPYVKGKYIAINEGDDYWCDNSKLQKQVDFLEKNDDYSLVVHRANMVNIKGQIMKTIGGNKNIDYSIKDIILGGGDFIATNSMLFRSELFFSLPDFYHNSDIGDYIMCIYYASMGKVHYMSQIMSVYRFSSEGSWTQKYIEDNDFFNKHIEKMKSILDEINVHYNYKYDNILQEEIENYNMQKAIRYYKYYEFKKNDRYNFNRLSYKQRIILFCKSYFPFLIKIHHKLRGI